MVLEESHKKIHEKSPKLDSCIHDQSVYLIIACEKSHPLLPARVVFHEKNVCDCTWHRAWLWLELFASTVGIFLSWIYYLFSCVFSSETPYLYFEKAIRLSRGILKFLAAIRLSFLVHCDCKKCTSICICSCRSIVSSVSAPIKIFVSL